MSTLKTQFRQHIKTLNKDNALTYNRMTLRWFGTEELFIKTAEFIKLEVLINVIKEALPAYNIRTSPEPTPFDCRLVYFLVSFFQQLTRFGVVDKIGKDNQEVYETLMPKNLKKLMRNFDYETTVMDYNNRTLPRAFNNNYTYS